MTKSKLSTYDLAIPKDATAKGLLVFLRYYLIEAHKDKYHRRLFPCYLPMRVKMSDDEYRNHPFKKWFVKKVG